jgi:hypothetical protein
MGGFNTFMKTFDDISANSGAAGSRQIGSSIPNTTLVSWWMMQNDSNANMVIPRNAYISSFDEHVMILHNLLSNSNVVDSASVAAGWANNAPYFDNPDNVNSTANLNNTSVNYGPYVVNSFAQNKNN